MDEQANHAKSHSRRLCGDEGASLTEYALLLALIALTCLGAVSFFGGNTGNSASDSANKISTAIGGSGS
jgi:Flp pilus assembly pilin Flp